MLRTLRGRITFSYTAFVMILFLFVAAVLAREAVMFYSRATNDAIAAAANQIRQIVAQNPNAGFTSLAGNVHQMVERPGLHIIGFEHPEGVTVGRPPLHFGTHRRAVYVPISQQPRLRPAPPGSPPGGPPPPDGDRNPGNRTLFSISNLIGIHPERIDTKIATFFVSPDPDVFRSLLTSYAMIAFGGLIVCGLIGFLIGRYLADQALAPMIAVTGALQRFADGDFTPQRIDTQDRTEVGELASAFNGAASQVSAAFDERRRVEEYIRQFVADASHELRTPLTVIRGYLDVLKRGALADPIKRDRAFATLDTESARMRALIDKLVVLARLERPQPSQLARVDVAAVARNLAEAVRDVPGHPPVALVLDDGAHVLAEESELHEALANLLDNARKYGAGAPIELQVKREGSFVIARVVDAGPGIPDDEQSHIFDRFFRGAARGEIEGSGLGLAIAVHAVSRAHGTLRLLESRPGRTVFEIKLPAAPQIREEALV
ncbi:MAG TPA: HAMP domain-containing sensor histidine kinase [Candidatus Baltobacteraceae bacterium]|jgi:signal transduction histidine kinase